MNTDILQGNWKQFTGEMKAQWGKLTDDQWTTFNGNREKLSGAIQKEYGIARDEADRQIADWEKAHEAKRKSA